MHDTILGQDPTVVSLVYLADPPPLITSSLKKINIHVSILPSTGPPILQPKPTHLLQAHARLLQS